MNVPFDPTDLSECDREKIHQIGTVQSFGCLFAISAHWKITRISENYTAILGLDSPPIIGSDLGDWINKDALAALREAARRLNADKQIERLFGLRLHTSGPLFDCAIHASGTGLILEFEPHGESYDDLLGLVGPLIAQLSDIHELTDLCMEATKAIRSLTGYSRVMVYRFRRDLSGEVIAESARDELEPYLGLRYPKDDIPLPARELFLLNRVRVIADVGAEPSPIGPNDAERRLIELP